eukprot:COSAG02_NODE_41761_length_391_cov_0.880137_1_plen_64_part_10
MSAVNLTQLSHNDLLLYIQEQDRKLEQKTDEANRAWDIVQSQALELEQQTNRLSEQVRFTGKVQ